MEWTAILIFYAMCCKANHCVIKHEKLSYRLTPFEVITISSGPIGILFLCLRDLICHMINKTINPWDMPKV